MNKPFSIKQRVYFEDTDAIGIVYYANYLRYMERARSEWLWSLGFCFDSFAKNGNHFVIHHVDITYHQPAKLKDDIEVTAELIQHKNSSVVFSQCVRNANDDKLIYAKAKVRVVCINEQGRPKPFPKDVLEKLQ